MDRIPAHTRVHRMYWGALAIPTGHRVARKGSESSARHSTKTPVGTTLVPAFVRVGLVPVEDGGPVVLPPGTRTRRHWRWRATARSAAAPRLCHKCQRSATCVACGAPAVAASPPRFMARASARGARTTVRGYGRPCAARVWSAARQVRRRAPAVRRPHHHPHPDGKRCGRRPDRFGAARSSVGGLVVLGRLGQPRDAERHVGGTRTGGGSRRRRRPRRCGPVAPPRPPAPRPPRPLPRRRPPPDATAAPTAMTAQAVDPLRGSR